MKRYLAREAEELLIHTLYNGLVMIHTLIRLLIWCLFTRYSKTREDMPTSNVSLRNLRSWYAQVPHICATDEYMSIMHICALCWRMPVRYELVLGAKAKYQRSSDAQVPQLCISDRRMFSASALDQSASIHFYLFVSSQSIIN